MNSCRFSTRPMSLTKSKVGFLVSSKYGYPPVLRALWYTILTTTTEGYQMPFISLTGAMGDILYTGTSDKPASEGPPAPGSEPELLHTTALDTTLRSIFESSDDTTGGNAQLHALSKKIVARMTSALDDLLAKFPVPASAPGHVERVRSVLEFVEQGQQWTVRLGKTYGVEQGVLEPHLATLRPYVHELGVLIGDVAELYPTAIEALVLNLSAVLLPEAIFIRSLVILYCFGPYVLGKDAISGWVFKQISEVLWT
ncbi:hypothetical protein BS17DRAFT_76945 [Gyrodon lividus]|nr:hypothetical protein BS17DRAFT_76945 [Gyrodon lividus]